jgi:hypothetical protein
MLTDDDLTRQLSAAFRADTQDLVYAGRRRPPAAMAVTLSTTAAAGVAAAAVVGAVALTDGSGSPNTHGRHVTSAITSGPTKAHHHGGQVSQTLELAGFSITYSYPAGSPNPVIARAIKGGLPQSAQPLSLDRPDAHAWSGTDPMTGDTAVYVKLDRPGDLGAIFALESSTWTVDQLRNLLQNPVPVPAVTD